MARAIKGLPGGHSAVPLADIQTTDEWLNHPRLVEGFKHGPATRGYTLLDSEGRTLGVVGLVRTLLWGCCNGGQWMFTTANMNDIRSGDNQVWLGLILSDCRVYETATLEQMVDVMIEHADIEPYDPNPGARAGPAPEGDDLKSLSGLGA